MRSIMLVICLVLAGPATAADALLETYAATSVGLFSTAAQHSGDARYDLAEAVIARIMPDSADGVWLYQEQSVVSRPGMTMDAARTAPYFQRIGHIVQLPDGRLRRDNHVIKDPARFIGLGRKGYAGPQPTLADVGDAGCHNIITPIATGHFTATTENCRNSYKGAATMVSLAVITPDTYANWDRGFDAAGLRVWGPVAGGYVFRRQP